MPHFDSLHFDLGWQKEAVKPVEGRLTLNAKALFQLMAFHACTRPDRTFRSRDLKLFFEGNSHNAAFNWFWYVGRHLLLETPTDTLHDGATQRYSVEREREKNGTYWRALSAPIESVSVEIAASCERQHG